MLLLLLMYSCKPYCVLYKLLLLTLSIDTTSKTALANIVRPGVILHYGFILLTFLLDEQDMYFL